MGIEPSSQSHYLIEITHDKNGDRPKPSSLRASMREIVASVVFCLCPPVFGMSPCPNLGQLRIEGKSFVERGESLSESLQIAIHLWLWAPAIQNDGC
jgi:hypothetical protein